MSFLIPAMLIGLTVAAQDMHRDTAAALTDAIDKICAPVLLGGDPARLAADAFTRGWKPVAGADPVRAERTTPDGRIVVEWPSVFRNCKVSLYSAALTDDREVFRSVDAWAGRQAGMTMTPEIRIDRNANVYNWSSPRLKLELKSQFKPHAASVPHDHLVMRPVG